jgi:intraflagellar transport protein 56
MMVCHSKMMDNTHDQLCGAAIQYLRGNYDEAVEIYKKMMIENREYQALNIYCALCYYKQEYFEISLDMMSNYLSSYPNSIVATNLKACNYFQLLQVKNAEDEFKRLEKNYKGGDLYADYDLLRHNLCVFRGGENALQV